MPSTVANLEPAASAAREFDAFAADYEQALASGLALSGEGPDYYARRRICWTQQVLCRHNAPTDHVLDFGCGVGLAGPIIKELLWPREIWGYDPSTEAIARAQREHCHAKAIFCDTAEEIPTDHFDLVYCNGVFHHIQPAERPVALATIYQALRPGGWFAFWENNPWNLGTRLVMRRIPFDRDAVVISPLAAGRLLRSAGFRTKWPQAWFLFPHALRWLRPLERAVYQLPLGGQYVVLAQKPHEASAEGQ